MLDAKRVAKINAMSLDEMSAEVNRGRFSRFNEESRALMTARIAELQASRLGVAETRGELHRVQTAVATQEGIRWSKWMVVITLVGVIVAVAAYLHA